jgi:hypothetical protein
MTDKFTSDDHNNPTDYERGCRQALMDIVDGKVLRESDDFLRGYRDAVLYHCSCEPIYSTEVEEGLQ